MKRFSISLVIKEIQIKTLMTHHTPYWKKFKSLKIPSIHEDIEQLEIADMSGGNMYWHNTLEKTDYLVKSNIYVWSHQFHT